MAIKRARKTTVQPVGRPQSDINVTPLVDVVLVLLIIFMVVTPLLEKDISVRLPEDQDEQLELPPDQQSQIVVQISATGELALNTERLSFEQLEERLRKALKSKPRGERLVFFLPEEQANYGVVVQALDTAKSSGADILGMVTIDLSAQAQQTTPASPPP